MEKRFPDLEEEKSTYSSLATGILVIILLTFIQLVSELLRIYIPSYTPWLEKLVIIIILCLILRAISKNHDYIKKLENFLLAIGKKKRKNFVPK
jgi:hypothetical protein